MLRLIILVLAALTFTLISKPIEAYFQDRTMVYHALDQKSTAKMSKALDSAFFPKDIKIVGIGDSLTMGYGDESGNGGYLTTLKEDLLKQREYQSVETENFGVGGLRSKQLNRMLDREEVSASVQDADIVLITIGGNDIIQVVQENFMDLSSEHFREANSLFNENLNHTLSEIKTLNPNSRVFVLGIYNPLSSLFPNVPEFDEIVGNWNKETAIQIANFDDTYFIPIDDVFKGKEKDYLYKDFIHPNQVGYENISKRVVSYIDQYHTESLFVNGETKKESE